MIRQLTFLFLIIVAGCSTPKYTAETRVTQSSGAGQIQLVTGGYGLTKKQAAQNATENAFKTLLVYGVPNSNQETPLLGAGAEKKFASNKAFFDQFLNSQLDNFISSRKVNGFNFTNDKTPSTEVKLLINLTSLRNHLIANDIISEFGI